MPFGDASNVTEFGSSNGDKVSSNSLDLEPGRIQGDGVSRHEASVSKPVSRLETRFYACPMKSISRYGKTLTLLIGPDAQQFTVHTDRLTSKSEYFRSALQGNWKETKDNTFILPEENVSVFSFFIDWLYDSRLHYSGTAADSFRFLVEAYLFGERRGVRLFRNAIISEINTWWPQNIFSCLDICTLVFTETTAESKLRQLIIDHIVWEGRLADFQAQDGAELHPELAVALFAGLLERVRPGLQEPIFKFCIDGGQHSYRCVKPGCLKCPDTKDVAYLAPVREAPYTGSSSVFSFGSVPNTFCPKYHEHMLGEVQPGISSFSCGTQRHP